MPDCLVCTCPIDPDTERFFDCPNSPEKAHCLCGSCFLQYVDSCCSEYALGNKIPLRCSIPSCKYAIPEAEIKRILFDEILDKAGPAAWDRYLNVQVKVALGGIAKAATDAAASAPDEYSPGKLMAEFPITCHLCDYTEIWVGAPPQYWEQLGRIKALGKYTAMDAAQKYLDEETKKIKKSTAEKIKEAQDYAEEQKKMIRGKYKPTFDEIEAKFAEEKAKAEAEKDDNLAGISSQLASTELRLWEILSKMHQMVYSEPIEEKTFAKPTIRALMDESKDEPEDFELMFEFIPDEPGTSDMKLVSEWYDKRLKQCRLQLQMVNVEYRMLQTKVDEQMFAGETWCSERIKFATDQKEIELAEPKEMERLELEDIENVSLSIIEQIKADEDMFLQIAKAERDRILERKMELLNSDYMMIKLREKLMMKVNELDKIKALEKLKGKKKDTTKAERAKIREEEKKLEESLSIRGSDASKIFSDISTMFADALKSKKDKAAGLKKDKKTKDELKVEAPMKKRKSSIPPEFFDVDINDFLDDKEELKIDPENFSAETSQFFVCKSIGCAGAICIRCQMRLKTTEVKDHICKFDEITELYNKLIEVLADASSQKCPKCKSAWQKDLACTHMTCEKCGEYWCYHCGISKSTVGGDWSDHNSWTIDTPETDKKCPMYLHYKYGDKLNGKVRDGDPLKALNAFHSAKQKAAVEEFQSSVDPDLWAKMVAEKFPMGIWDEEKDKLKTK